MTIGAGLGRPHESRDASASTTLSRHRSSRTGSPLLACLEQGSRNGLAIIVGRRTLRGRVACAGLTGIARGLTALEQVFGDLGHEVLRAD